MSGETTIAGWIMGTTQSVPDSGACSATCQQLQDDIGQGLMALVVSHAPPPDGYH